MRGFLAALLCAWMPAVAGAEVCVVNGAEERLLFAAEARGGPRATRMLAPGGELCVPGTDGGVVSAYLHRNAMEGCSRLVPPGASDRLIRYAEFDRCEWASHGRD